MKTWWGRRRRGERGATTVEYGMLVAAIAAACVTFLTFEGTLQAAFTDSCQSTGLATPSSPC